jgi:hypothetical protein
MNKLNLKWLHFLIGAGLLAACQVVRNAPPPPTPKPTPLPTISEVLEACNPDTQAMAMRKYLVPNWENLGLSACYQLDLTLSAEGGNYSGEAQITLENRTGVPLPDLVFRLYPNANHIYGGSLQVSRAQVNEQSLPPEKFLEDDTAIRLTLPETLAPGELAVIHMSFEGQTPINFGDLPDSYGIFNFDADQEVLALANWYPILAVWEEGNWRAAPVIGVGDAVVSEAALYQARITAPANWRLVSTGSEIKTESSGGQTIREVVSGPVREFIVLAGPNFVETSQESNGVLIRHWGLPGSEGRWEEARRVTIDSLSIFDERFGLYPYTELDIVATPLKGGALGVEYPGVFLIGDTLYQPDEEQPYLLGIVVAHETAHQWWYGVVGNDVLVYPWQDEGLTTFSSLVYLEAFQPYVYEGARQAYQDTLASLDSETGDFSLSQPVTAFLDKRRAYSPVIYQKGALFFDELRRELGDEVFFAGLQAYYAGNQYQLAEPADLLSAFETSCGCRLDRLYRTWGVTP